MKFNTLLNNPPTANLAGGPAFFETPELELVSLLLTSFLKDKYYESESEQLQRLKRLIESIADKKFIAKAAIFARNEFGIRSITHALIGELLTKVKGEPWLKQAIAHIIKRPDDILEIVAYYFLLHRHVGYKKGLPAALRKGIRLAINKFDGYQLAKYRGESKQVKMVDIFNLVHPKASCEKQAVFKDLIKGDLKATQTWEYQLTQAGQAGQTVEEVADLKKESWNELISQRKIGYFALLRNLRNIIAQAPESLSSALELLTDATLIQKSGVLPFRFLTAIQSLQELNLPEARLTIAALNRALDLSFSNIPHFPGKTLVALDTSGSMQGTPITIGSLFAAAFFKTSKADILLFSETAKYFSYGSISDSLSTIAEAIKAHAYYQSTNFHAIFLAAHKAYDRIIILSDMQAWVGNETPLSSLKKYKAEYKVQPAVYSVDLNGYGTLQFPEKDIYCISGFSEKIFDLLKYCEHDKQALITNINSIEL